MSGSERPSPDGVPAAATPRLERAPRAITIDLDDTLWPMLPVLKGAEQALSDWLARHAPATAAAFTVDARTALRQRVIDDHPERAHDVGFLRLELLRRALASAGDDPGLAAAAYAVFFEARQQVTLYADVLPVLERWSSRMPLVAVTNGNADLRRIGLSHLFAGVVSAHEMGCAKPDPRVFHAGCELTGCAPADVLHVGDDPRLDVEGARAAGLQAAWLLRPDLAHRHAAASREPMPFASLSEIDHALSVPLGN